MSILNTIYFYDEWQNRFQKDKTKTDSFYPAAGDAVETEFMNSRYGSHSFTKGEHYTRSELPLKTNGSMVFVLPDEGASVEELLESPEALRNALEGGTRQMGEATFKVPKFTMDSNFDVKEMMETFGITKIFTDGDFSAMTDNKEIGITKISQDGHISINEEGVEASAFTELQYAGAALPKGKADMILNRPFLFGISSKHARIDGQQTWLFIGICDNPSAS